MATNGFRITDACRRPATTTADALLAAFKAMNVKRVVLITPYVKAVNLREVQLLTHYGIKVLNETGLDLTEGSGMASVSPDEWVELARKHRDDTADVYFPSGTTIDVTPIIDRLEQELGRPDVTRN
ncbi:MAG: hypothetical protein ACOH2J_02080 [Allorhizobium sp.]